MTDAERLLDSVKLLELSLHGASASNFLFLFFGLRLNIFYHLDVRFLN